MTNAYSSRYHKMALLSAQCMSSIREIITLTSVCLCVREPVCHTKRVERSTGRNLPPIFTKLAIMVVSQEMWSPIVFGGNPEYLWPSNREWN